MAFTVAVTSVGKPKALFRPLIEEYEARSANYFDFSADEVREESSRHARDAQRVLTAEGERLLARLRDGERLVAVTRAGKRWKSERFARYLKELQDLGAAGARFVIGGAFGLAASVLGRSEQQLSLSAFTLPHDLARLVLTEQIYRAGSILRGEPYHKSNLNLSG